MWLALGLMAAGLGLIAWSCERTERQQTRIGICPREWERGREKVAKNMTTVWQRAEMRMQGFREDVVRAVSEWRSK